MNKWLAIPDETKKNAYIQIAEKTGMSAFAVEKDWWVVQALSVIFDMEIGEHLIFKGGTSLSKVWQLIKRFSEDIDLAIDRSFLGFSGELSKNKRDQLRKRSSEYTAETFFPELQKKFEERGIIGLAFNLVETKDSDKDPRIIEIYYPNLIESPGYLVPKIQIEISCRSLREPNTLKTFSSLVDEEYAGREFVAPPITVQTVNPERTFLEKIFLLHEEFHRPAEKMRVNRLSRHLYDIYHLAKTNIAERAYNDKELYQTIVEHRHKFTRVSGVNYNDLQPQTINPLPIPEVMEAWKEDYKKMLEEMIYEENPPTFEDLINELTTLKNKINAVEWKFDVEFPKPVQQNLDYKEA